MKDDGFNLLMTIYFTIALGLITPAFIKSNLFNNFMHDQQLTHYITQGDELFKSRFNAIEEVIKKSNDLNAVYQLAETNPSGFNANVDSIKPTVAYPTLNQMVVMNKGESITPTYDGICMSRHVLIKTYQDEKASIPTDHEHLQIRSYSKAIKDERCRDD